MKNLNLPTKFTLSRILAVPLILILLTKESSFANILAALVFGAAAFTDYLDGYLARTTDTITPLGKLLDPIADKVLILSVLIPMIAIGHIPAWLGTLIISREFAVTGVRMMAATENHIIPANWKGKWKTGFEIAAMEFLILQWDIGIIHFQTIGTILIYIAVVFSLWGAYDYLEEYWNRQYSKP